MNLKHTKHTGLSTKISTLSVTILVSGLMGMCALSPASGNDPTSGTIEISRSEYHEKLKGFWLGQSIANWTGLVTEMDKIGGEGSVGEFYRREDWGQPDQPSIWGEGVPSALSPTIDWVFENEAGVWGSDDDTDIEYLYQALLNQLRHFNTHGRANPARLDGRISILTKIHHSVIAKAVPKIFCGYQISGHMT